MQRAVERVGLFAALALAAMARAPAFLLGVEHYGDSPVRVELAERWAAAPHLWRGFSEAYQFGPLHLSLLGAALRIWPARFWSPRLVSLACGLLGVWLLFRIAARTLGAPAALCAACVLALSPLHIQASTSSASEAVFLALFLAALDRLLAARESDAAQEAGALPGPAVAGGGAGARRGPLAAAAVLLGAAGLVRYDGWLYVPLFCGVLLLDWRKGRRPLFDVVWFGALSALPAALWLWQNHRFGGALAPLRHIDLDHRGLAAMGLGWYGPVGYRLYCLVYWPAAMLILASPVAGALALGGAARTLFRCAPGWELVALGWIPAAYLTFRGAVLADFRPLARFAMVAMALSLPFAWSAALWLAARGGPRLLRAAVALGACALVATPAALAFASFGRNGGAAEWARPLSPISSVPPGIAQAARYLREHAGPDDVVLLDGVWDYLDIPLAFESGLPESRLVRRAWDNFEERLTQTPPTMAVLIYQGKLQTTSGAAGAVETADRFEFRGTPFCAEAKFVYASIYRRCAGAEAAKVQ
jgi:4-amino-4-deoxy-L-arabinose transferase-like glycosyltransferase